MQDLDALVEVAQPPRERHRRALPGRVAGVPQHLGERHCRSGHAIGEVGHTVRRGVGRSEHRGYRDLRPRPLRDGVIEDHALSRETVQDWRRFAFVAVARQVVPAQRVVENHDDPLRRHPLTRCLCPGNGGDPSAAAPHRGRAPEPDRSGGFRCNGERERDLFTGERVEVDALLVPLIGSRHGPLEHRLRRAARLPLHRHRELDRGHLRRPNGEIQPGSRRQAEPPGGLLRAAGHDGLPEYVRESLPAHASGDRSEVFAAEHESNRLDLEVGAGDVRRVHDHMPHRGRGEGGREERGVRRKPIRLHLVAGDDRRRQLPADLGGPAEQRSELQLLGADECHAEVGARGRVHADDDLVERVGAVQPTRALDVHEPRLVGGAAAQHGPVDAQSGHPRSGLPTPRAERAFGAEAPFGLGNLGSFFQRPRDHGVAEHIDHPDGDGIGSFARAPGQSEDRDEPDSLLALREVVWVGRHIRNRISLERQIGFSMQVRILSLRYSSSRIP